MSHLTTLININFELIFNGFIVCLSRLHLRLNSLLQRACFISSHLKLLSNTLGIVHYFILIVDVYNT